MPSDNILTIKYFLDRGSKDRKSLDPVTRAPITVTVQPVPITCKDTARARAGFDCWMQEQEENFQPDDIEACCSQFFVTLEYIADALKPKPMAKKVEPPPVPANEFYVVYFGFDRAGLTDRAKAILELASAAAEKLKGAVTVSGHTDLVGGEEYNWKLSEWRAQAVHDALFKAGLSSAAIKMEHFGETRPAINTPGPEARNRRVEIVIGVKARKRTLVHECLLPGVKQTCRRRGPDFAS